MKAKYLIIFPTFLLLFVIFCSPLLSLGRREEALPVNQTKSKEYVVILEGRLRLVGSEPFRRLVLSTSEGRDYIVERQSPAGRELEDLQGREVSVRGRVRESAVYAGRDRYLGQEYFIIPSDWSLLDLAPLN